MEKTVSTTDENKIMMMLVRIGDENVEKIDSHVQKLCSHLCTQIEVLTDFITDTFIDCISNIPHKSFLYAQILHTLAVDEQEHAVNIVTKVFEKTHELIKQGKDVSNQIRLLSALVDTGFLNAHTYEGLLKQFLEAYTQSQNQYYLHLATYGYIYALRAFKAFKSTNLTELEGQLNTAISAIPPTENPKTENFLHMMNDLILHCQKDQSLFDTSLDGMYLTPSKTYREELQAKNVTQMNAFPELSLNAELGSHVVPSYFDMYKARFIAENHKVAYVLAQDLIRCVLHSFKANPFFACQRLTTLPGIPMLPYVIFDVIFDEVLREIGATKNTIFYSSICVTMIKEFTQDGIFEFGPAMGEALQLVFGSADSANNSQNEESTLQISHMNYELIDRLIDWLIFFLTQQDFGWDWDSWAFVAELPDYNIQKVFVRTILTKSSALIDPKSLAKNLPESLLEFLPMDKSGVFVHATDNKDNYEVQLILDKMSARESAEGMSQNVFETEANSETFIEVFSECFLYKTQKSLRHIGVLFNKFKTFMLDKFGLEENQVKLLATIFRVWAKDSLKIINICMEMLELGILSEITLIKFCFEEIRVNKESQDLYWKEWAILHKIVNRVCIKLDLVKGDALDEMEDASQQVALKAKEAFTCLFDSFSACANGVEQGSQEDQGETGLPTEERVKIIHAQKECFQRQYSDYIKQFA